MHRLESLVELLRECHGTIESSVNECPGSYRALSFEALYTSIDDLTSIFRLDLLRGDFVDLGSGVGLPVLVYGLLFPKRKSTGVEFQQERVSVAWTLQKSLALKNVDFVHSDLMNTPIPDGDTYFLYFPTGPVLDRILSELYKKPHDFNLLVIESHGDLLPRIEKENWLTLEAEIPLISKRHYPMARVYRREFVERSPDLAPFELSFKPMYLLVREGEDRWVGETFGMEWVSGERFNLSLPPRTIHWTSVDTVLSIEDFSPPIQELLGLRKKGEVRIIWDDKVHQGSIRKIYLPPKFLIEISSGEKLQWSHDIKIYQDSVLCLDASSYSCSSLLAP